MTRRLAAMATLLVLAGVALAAGAEPVGAVAALEGRAEVRRAGQAAWSGLAGGEAVFLGDRVRTAANSKVKLVLRDESVLTLAAGTEVVLDEQTAAPAARSRLSLLAGTLRALVSQRYGGTGASFEVETPTAVAGVRGTTFLVRFDSARETTRVVGLSNVTWVRSRTDTTAREAVELGDSLFTDVGRGRRPTRPVPISDAELAPLLDATELPAGGIDPEAELGAGAEEDGDVDAVGPDGQRAEPHRPGYESLSPEERIIDQPIEELKGPPGGRPVMPTTPPATAPPATAPPPTAPPPTAPPPTRPPPTTPPPTQPPQPPGSIPGQPGKVQKGPGVLNRGPASRGPTPSQSPVK